MARVGDEAPAAEKLHLSWGRRMCTGCVLSEQDERVHSPGLGGKLWRGRGGVTVLGPQCLTTSKSPLRMALARGGSQIGCILYRLPIGESGAIKGPRRLSPLRNLNHEMERHRDEAAL